MTFKMSTILAGGLVALTAACGAFAAGFDQRFGAAPEGGMDPQYRAILKELVEVNSGTGNAEGLQRNRQIIRREFEARGLEVRELPHGDNVVLVAKLPEATPKILFMGHIDTVFKPTDKTPPYSEDGAIIRGPGVIDMKGGIVMMMNLWDHLAPKERANILIVLNDDEEIGSPGTKETYLKELDGISHVMVFEPGLPDGAFVSSQSGVKWITLETTGKAAHAGTDHDKGINACSEAGHQIVQLHGLTEYDKNLTVNIGTMTGGTVPNAVCDKATVRVDIRYKSQQDLDELMAKIRAIVADPKIANPKTGKPTQGKVIPVVQLPSLPPEVSEKMVGIATQAAHELGVPFHHTHVGYGSDGNHISVLPVSILVGVGPIGGGMHTLQEFMDTTEYEQRLLLNKKIIELITR